MLIPQNIVDSLKQRDVEIAEPIIMLGKSKIKIEFDYMLFTPDLSSATPICKAIVVERPERKPRKPRTTAQPTNKNKK